MMTLIAGIQIYSQQSHLSAVKRIIGYLLGTINLGLWYPKNSTYNLIGYSDSDFSGSKTDRKQKLDKNGNNKNLRTNLEFGRTRGGELELPRTLARV